MMDERAMYAASVPVFLHYSGRLLAIMDRLEDETAMDSRLASDALSTRAHFKAAQGYVLRVVFPLIGCPVPDLLPDEDATPALRKRAAEVARLLEAVSPSDFDGAATRVIRHKAGFAEIEQSGQAFLTLYGMPTFMFHLSMGYAGLRVAGVAVGKSDFDGFHIYPRGFHW